MLILNTLISHHSNELTFYILACVYAQGCCSLMNDLTFDFNILKDAFTLRIQEHIIQSH